LHVTVTRLESIRVSQQMQVLHEVDADVDHGRTAFLLLLLPPPRASPAVAA
jgi:hypothetical protein